MRYGAARRTVNGLQTSGAPINADQKARKFGLQWAIIYVTNQGAPTMCEDCESEWVDVPRKSVVARPWSAEQTAKFVDDLLDVGGHSGEFRDYFLALKGRALGEH